MAIAVLLGYVGGLYGQESAVDREASRAAQPFIPTVAGVGTPPTTVGESPVPAAEKQEPQPARMWNPLAMAWLTSKQIDLLTVAFAIGQANGDLNHAALLQAVLFQETIAGRLGRIGHLSAPVGKRSYGVMQVKVTAARDVLRHHPEMGRFRTDEELIVRLMTDDVFNIRIASKFLRYLRGHTESDEAALVAYNIGLRASRDVSEPARFDYVKGVQRYRNQLVAPYNKRFHGADLRVAAR